MSSGFEIGRVYNRRIDIHGQFGGQQQGGIITPAQHPIVIIVTGEEGLEHGYADRYRDDGVFEYFGEGQVGDMQLRAGTAPSLSIPFKEKDFCFSRRPYMAFASKGKCYATATITNWAPTGMGTSATPLFLS